MVELKAPNVEVAEKTLFFFFLPYDVATEFVRYGLFLVLGTIVGKIFNVKFMYKGE